MASAASPASADMEGKPTAGDGTRAGHSVEFVVSWRACVAWRACGMRVRYPFFACLTNL